jgi:hypothetical protein
MHRNPFFIYQDVKSPHHTLALHHTLDWKNDAHETNTFSPKSNAFPTLFQIEADTNFSDIPYEPSQVNSNYPSPVLLSPHLDSVLRR